VGETATILQDALAQVGRDIDNAFDSLLPLPGDARDQLYEAMRHAAIGGGKRLRPLLVQASADMFGVSRESALRTGLAVECIHVYSLIHDDLPAMDDDDMRRGKPTVHRMWDDATAVLAGDCLHDLAFEVLADPATHEDPFVRVQLMSELARSSGPAGMAGGQMLDLMADALSLRGERFDLGGVTRLQQLKTGALIGFCTEAGAILGHVPPEGRTHLRGYARDIGLAFQIVDDLIDAEGDAAVAGKATGKDAAAGKETFVSLLGLERAREQAHMLVEQAQSHLAGYGEKADLLRAIAQFIVARDH